jgi:hypothetical protein
VQPQHGPTVAFAGSGRVDRQQAGDFLIGKPLEVPHQDYFTIDFREFVQRLMEPARQFLPAQALTWGAAGHEFFGKCLRRLLRPGRLAAQGPPGCPKMMPVGLGGAVTSDLPKPKAKWHGPFLQVGVKPAKRFQMCLLDNVRGIDTSAQPGFQSQFHQLAHEGFMFGEKALESQRITGGSLLCVSAESGCPIVIAINLLSY